MRVFIPLLVLVLSLTVLAECVKGEGGDEIPATSTADNSDFVDEAEDDELGGPQPLDTMSDEFEAQLKEGAESFEFQAELNRLMDIIVHSLYRDKSVFLRELISNAADALERVRFLALSDPSVVDANPDLEIRVYYNADLNQISIRDTGIGMTRLELIESLGTVAKSGTTNFMEALAQTGDISQIGQFGVGFYSAYLVADKVQVISKHNDDDQHVWGSSASSEFTVSKDPRGNTLVRGTEVILHLKEDSKEYGSHMVILRTLNKHSEFTQYPIFVYMSDKEYEISKERKAAAARVKKQEEAADEDFVDLDGDSSEDGQPKDDEEDAEEDAEEIIGKDNPERYRLLNENAPIWTRPKNELVDTDYDSFYKVLSRDYASAPAAYTHFKAEGDVEFTSILYVPSKMSFSRQGKNYYDLYPEIKLYVRRVLVSDSIKDLLPQYLNFIVGMIDTDSILLNVNRENIQDEKAVSAIKSKLVGKVYQMLIKLAKEAEKAEINELDGDEKDEDIEGDDSDAGASPAEGRKKYDEFYEAFGNNIRYGFWEDRENIDKLTTLLRFKSSKSEGKWRSVAGYKKGMKDWQKFIYFVSGDSDADCKNSPFMDMYRDNDVEVFFVTDPQDEYIFDYHTSLDGTRHADIAKAGTSISGKDNDDEKRLAKAYNKKFNPLSKYLQNLYSEKFPLIKVRVSDRAAKLPALVSSGSGSYSAHLLRMSKLHAVHGKAEDERKSVLSRSVYINPRHPIVDELLNLVIDDGDNEIIPELAWALYDTATVSSGFDVSSKEDFSSRMYNMIARKMDIKDTETLLPEIDIPEEDEEEEGENDEIDMMEDDYSDQFGSDRYGNISDEQRDRLNELSKLRENETMTPEAYEEIVRITEKLSEDNKDENEL